MKVEGTNSANVHVLKHFIAGFSVLLKNLCIRNNYSETIKPIFLITQDDCKFSLLITGNASVCYV